MFIHTSTPSNMKNVTFCLSFNKNSLVLCHNFITYDKSLIPAFFPLVRAWSLYLKIRFGNDGAKEHKIATIAW